MTRKPRLSPQERLIYDVINTIIYGGGLDNDQEVVAKAAKIIAMLTSRRSDQ